MRGRRGRNRKSTENNDRNCRNFLGKSQQVFLAESDAFQRMLREQSERQRKNLQDFLQNTDRIIQKAANIDRLRKLKITS